MFMELFLLEREGKGTVWGPRREEKECAFSGHVLRTMCAGILCAGATKCKTSAWACACVAERGQEGRLWGNLRTEHPRRGDKITGE